MSGNRSQETLNVKVEKVIRGELFLVVEDGNFCRSRRCSLDGGICNPYDRPLRDRQYRIAPQHNSNWGKAGCELRESRNRGIKEGEE